MLDVVPLADAVTLPACPLPRNVVVIPAFHGELLATRWPARGSRLPHPPLVTGAPSLRPPPRSWLPRYRMADPESAAPPRCAVQPPLAAPTSQRRAAGTRAIRSPAGPVCLVQCLPASLPGTSGRSAQAPALGGKAGTESSSSWRGSNSAAKRTSGNLGTVVQRHVPRARRAPPAVPAAARRIHPAKQRPALLAGPLVVTFSKRPGYRVARRRPHMNDAPTRRR